MVEDGWREEEGEDEGRGGNDGEDSDDGGRESERVEIKEVGWGKEDSDEDDSGVGVEWGRIVVGRGGYDEEDGWDEERVVDVV